MFVKLRNFTRVHLNGWNDGLAHWLVLDGLDGQDVMGSDNFGQLFSKIKRRSGLGIGPFAAAEGDADDDDGQTESAQDGTEESQLTRPEAFLSQADEADDGARQENHQTEPEKEVDGAGRPVAPLLCRGVALAEIQRHPLLLFVLFEPLLMRLFGSLPMVLVGRSALGRLIRTQVPPWWLQKQKENNEKQARPAAVAIDRYRTATKRKGAETIRRSIRSLPLKENEIEFLDNLTDLTG